MLISKSRERIKDILLIFLITVVVLALLYFVLYDKVLKNYISFKINGKQESNIITSIKINDVILPFDRSTKTFYYPINAEEQGKNLTLNIKIENTTPTKNIIDSKEFKDSITIEKTVDFKDKIEIYSTSNYYYNKYYIAFTNLPTITISNKVSDVGEEYTFGNIKVIDPEYAENESEYNIDSQMDIRIRGSSSKNLPKKSYRIKLYQQNNKQSLSLLGLRNDSEWILDSLYTDISKIRNLLGYNVWNLMNQDIQSDHTVVLNGKFVEVFMDNEYVGLYVLKEPIDNNTLNLKETSSIDSGILLKGIAHDLPEFDENEIKSVKEEIYHGLELKYPKNLEDNSIYWYQILKKMKNYYSGNLTDETLKETFYMDNFINFRLFLLTLKSIDNYEPKNVYFSLKDMNNDTKILLTPWDLDLTFGVDWDTKSRVNMDRVNDIAPLNFINAMEYKKDLKNRWVELRKNALTEKKLNQIIDNYYKELTFSGAIDREYEKWNKGENVESEFSQIKNWFKLRLKVLDNYIEGL